MDQDTGATGWACGGRYSNILTVQRQPFVNRYGLQLVLSKEKQRKEKKTASARIVVEYTRSSMYV